MLTLTALTGFAAAAASPDVTPSPISWSAISNAGFVAAAQTVPVTMTGISVPIVLRASTSSLLAPNRTLTVWRDNIQIAQVSSGTTVDFTISNGQSLTLELTNAADLTTWAGLLSLTNLSDANALLASCSFTLQDTGSGGGGGGGGGEPP